MAPQVIELADEPARKSAQAVWGWVSKQRWAPQTTDGLEPIAVSLTQLGGGPADSKTGRAVWVLLLRSAEGEPLLNVPLVAAPAEAEQPAGEPIGTMGGLNLYDGAILSEYWTAWAHLATMVSGSREDLVEAAGEVVALGVEQSNSSVLLAGGSHLMVAKTFRVLHVGAHPEAELPAALTKANFEGVPPLWAYYDLAVAGESLPACTGVVSEAIRDAKDGFQTLVGMASRGEDPTAAAVVLGVLVRRMHDHLEETFGHGDPLEAQSLGQRVLCSTSSLRLAKPYVEDPDSLEQTLKDVRRLLGGLNLEGAGQSPTTRVHGDLHLGQTLVDPEGNWFILDFEGEPLRLLEERTQPDVPLRDVAGMLRSFDYAWNAGGNLEDATWLQDARQAFLDGYAGVSPLSEKEKNLLTALEVEKAIYEVAYESTFRPQYLSVPLAALDALIAAG